MARCAVDVFSIDPIEVSEPVEPLRALRIYPGEVCTLLLKPETIGDTTQKRVAPKNKRFVRCVRLASSSRTSPSKTLLPVPVIVYVEYIASNFENVRLTTPSRTIQSSLERIQVPKNSRCEKKIGTGLHHKNKTYLMDRRQSQSEDELIAGLCRNTGDGGMSERTRKVLLDAIKMYLMSRERHNTSNVFSYRIGSVGSTGRCRRRHSFISESDRCKDSRGTN